MKKLFSFVLLLFAFAAYGGEKYAVISGVYVSPDDGCTFFLVDIYDDHSTPGDKSDDIHWASGVIQGPCGGSIPHDPSNYHISISNHSTSENCEIFEIEITDNGTSVASGEIERCNEGERVRQYSKSRLINEKGAEEEILFEFLPNDSQEQEIKKLKPLKSSIRNSSEHDFTVDIPFGEIQSVEIYALNGTELGKNQYEIIPNDKASVDIHFIDTSHDIYIIKTKSSKGKVYINKVFLTK